MILSSPPSSSSSSSSSSCEFHRSCIPLLGFLARSTARSANIRVVESSFCFCSVASRCARTRASSGRYSLCARMGKLNDQQQRQGQGYGPFVFLARSLYGLEELGDTVSCHTAYAN